MSTRRRFFGASAVVMAGAALLFTFTGCVGYVEGPGGGAVIVAPPPPGVVVFGGDYDRDRDARSYSHRGYESRHDHDR